jgi:hypothetical protein
MEKITASILVVVSISLLAAAEEQKAILTFLDTLNKGKELSISNADFPPQTPVADSNPAKSVPKTEAGVVLSHFRIQVLASANEDQVKREKAKLSPKIDVPVTILFDTPYFKLFAGEFSVRNQAENYLAQVKKLGYNDAWILRVAAAKN